MNSRLIRGLEYLWDNYYAKIVWPLFSSLFTEGAREPCPRVVPLASGKMMQSNPYTQFSVDCVLQLFLKAQK